MVTLATAREPQAKREMCKPRRKHGAQGGLDVPTNGAAEIDDSYRQHGVDRKGEGGEITNLRGQEGSRQQEGCGITPEGGFFGSDDRELSLLSLFLYWTSA